MATTNNPENKQLPHEGNNLGQISIEDLKNQIEEMLFLAGDQMIQAREGRKPLLPYYEGKYEALHTVRQLIKKLG